MPQQTAVSSADAGMSKVKRVTAKEFADMAFERALANPDGGEAQVIFRLNEQHPDGIPRAAIFEEMSKAYPAISSKYELIQEGAGVPGEKSLGSRAMDAVSSATTSFLEPYKPTINRAIETMAPSGGSIVGAMGPVGAAAAGATQFMKWAAPPALRAVGANELADKVSGAGSSSQDLMTGLSQGFAEVGIDMASPTGIALIASGGPIRAIATKLPKAAALIGPIVKGTASVGLLSDLSHEVPAAYEAYMRGDYKEAGRAIAKATGDIALGVDFLRRNKTPKAPPAPTETPPLARAAAPPPAPAISTETAVDLYRRPASTVQIPAARNSEAYSLPVVDKRTGRPMTLRENTLPESEMQQMLRRPAEELIAERIAAEQRVAALERSAASQSQGGQVATVTLPDGRVQTVSSPEIPLAHTKDASGNFVANPGAIQAELAQARARLATLDRMIFARERAGTIPMSEEAQYAAREAAWVAAREAAGLPTYKPQFPPEHRAISTPEEIALRHGLPVEGPTMPRTGPEAPAGTFNLNQIWRESVAEIQARLSALARERTAYADRSSPDARDAERRIAALQDMLKAKRTAEIGGQPVPPVQPLPPDMGALPAARPAPMGVKPEAGVPALYESPSRAVPTGEGTPPRYTGPVSPVMTPEGPMYDQPMPKPRPMPGRPAQLLPEAGGEAAVLTPSGTSRVDMKALADKHKVDVEALRLVESTPDVEVVRVINELARTRAGILTGRGGQTALPGAPPAARSSHSKIKAKKGSANFEKERELSLEKIDNTINAYTELLRMRDPIYRSFVRNVTSQAPPATRSSSTPRTGRSKK